MWSHLAELVLTGVPVQINQLALIIDEGHDFNALQFNATDWSCLGLNSFIYHSPGHKCFQFQMQF